MPDPAQPYGDTTHDAQASRALSCAAFAWFTLAALAAMGISIYLLVVALRGGSVPGCGPDSGFGCSEVLSSPWSKWFDVPVSALAVLIYLSVLMDLWKLRMSRAAKAQRDAWSRLLVASILLIGAAAWFTGLQIVALHMKFCPYCLTAHGIGLILGIALLLAATNRPGKVGRPMQAVAVAVIGLVVLVGGQIAYKSKTYITQQVGAGGEIDTGPGPNRKISVLNGYVRLEPHDFPIIGSADAKHIIVLLFDYTCPYCRDQHHTLLDALERYGDDVALIVLPVPLEAKCNPDMLDTPPIHVGACELAKIALAVWKEDPAKFVELDRWLIDREPTPDMARQHAIELIGEKALDERLKDPSIDEFIARDMKLHDITSKYAGRRSIPQTIIGGLIIAGEPAEPDELFRLLEKDAKLKPVPGAPPLLPESPQAAASEPATSAPATSEPAPADGARTQR